MNQIGTDRIRDEPIPVRDAIFPGTVSGLIGAVLMGLVLILFALPEGDAWRPLKLIGAAVMNGEGTSGFHLAPIVIGSVIHLATAVLLGIFFAWIGGYMNVAAALGWGAMFGVSVWVIMQFGLLPVVNPWLAGVRPFPFALAHLVFGLALGFYPYFLPQEIAVPQVRRKAA